MLAAILTVALSTRFTHDLIGFIERKRFAAAENPHAPLFLQGLTRMYRLQGKAFAVRFEGETVAGFKPQFFADLLRNDNPTGLIDGYCIHNGI